MWNVKRALKNITPCTSPTMQTWWRVVWCSWRTQQTWNYVKTKWLRWREWQLLKCVDVCHYICWLRHHRTAQKIMAGCSLNLHHFCHTANSRCWHLWSTSASKNCLVLTWTNCSSPGNFVFDCVVACCNCFLQTTVVKPCGWTDCRTPAYDSL